MGKRTKDREFWESAKVNNASYLQYYNRLVELSVSMFEWQNLPDTVDPRYLELGLFGRGGMLFFEEPDIGMLALPYTNNGQLDIYNIPIYRRAFAVNGFHAIRDKSNSVIIWNNYLRTPSKLDVEQFSRRLYNIDRTIDVNVNAQKTPILIRCEETARLSMKQLYMQYDGNAPVIFGDTQLNPKNFEVLKTDAPFVAPDLYHLKTLIWNEALTYLGISNVNVTKKERLISDEVQRNLGGTIASRYSRLNARQQACEQINKMFGLDIWVDYREDMHRLDEETLVPEPEEGEEHE